jgi:hypothetical protein
MQFMDEELSFLQLAIRTSKNGFLQGGAKLHHPLPPETSRVSTTRRQDVTDQHQQKRANLWLRMLLPKESRKDADSVRHTSCRAIE